jgi:membrane protease YdiL (CAAX protease family)
MNTVRTQRAPTYFGLFIAMFGTPLFLWAFNLDVGAPQTLVPYLCREAGIFALLLVLLVIIRRGERLPYSSIGWHTDRLGNALLWGLLGLVLCAVALAGCLLIAQLLHWKIGAQTPARYEPPLWAMTITVLRAGVTEEAFYRGYALERLQSLTGRKSLAVILTIIPFALFHFRQGPAGILIAGVTGTILALIYLKRRSLPAVMFTHFTVDFVPNVLLPLLGMMA